MLSFRSALSPIGLQMTPGRSVLRGALDIFVRVATCLVGGGAAQPCLIGWVLDVALLKTVLPGLATMKVNTAFGFIFSAAALWLLHNSAPGSRPVHVARVLAVFVIVIGGAHCGGKSSLALILVSTSSFYLTARPPACTPAVCPWPRRSAFLPSDSTLLAFNARHARLAATALGWRSRLCSFRRRRSSATLMDSMRSTKWVCILPWRCIRPCRSSSSRFLSWRRKHHTGLPRIATSDTVGGEVSRRLLPTLPLMLFVLGWLCLQAERAGCYEVHFGVALTILLSVVVSVRCRRMDGDCASQHGHHPQGRGRGNQKS